MKKIYILFLAIFATANIYAQTYTISFAATGAATTMDSVKVENLTHPAIITWHAGDVLQLLVTTGINETGKNEGNIKVYPNPMQGQAEISFYANQASNATICIYDIAGKEVLQTVSNLSQGIQKFQLSGLKQGMYFINISGNGYFYTAKLISQNTITAGTKIKYIGNEKPEIIHTLKNTNTTITLPYITGDNLRFNGYAISHSAIVNDVPTASKTITFAFTSTICPPTVTDIDGNIYNTVSIGSQCWMSENLKTTKYRNGNAITNVTDSTAWGFSYGAYCDYMNIAGNSTIYGRLYNFYTVIDTSGLCPTGWHIPCDTAWTILITYLGGDGIAGGKLKEAGLGHWLSPNNAASNETGFTALPAGFRNSEGNFYFVGSNGYWWSSSAYINGNAWKLSMYYNLSTVSFNGIFKSTGMSVRCLRD